MLMMLIIVYEVVMRYFFNSPTRWSTDTAGYTIVFITCAAAAWILRQDAHVRIDVFLGRLSAKAQAVAEFVISIVCLLSCGLFAWHSWLITWGMYQRGDELMRGMLIPKHIVYWPIVACGFLLSIQFLRRAWQYWRVTRDTNS